MTTCAREHEWVDLGPIKWRPWSTLSENEKARVRQSVARDAHRGYHLSRGEDFDCGGHTDVPMGVWFDASIGQLKAGTWNRNRVLVLAPDDEPNSIYPCGHRDNADEIDRFSAALFVSDSVNK